MIGQKGQPWERFNLPVWLAMLPLLFALAVPANAAPDQDRIKLSFGQFDIFGVYSKRACTAQTFLKSARGNRMGFAIYWRPGKNLYVMTKHPAFAKAGGQQTVQFRFPDGQAMAFKMKRKGERVQASIGFSSTAKKFYKMIEANQSMRIELPAIGDTLDVSLKRRRELEAAMRHCKEWLRS